MAKSYTIGYISPAGRMVHYRNPLPTGLTDRWYRKGQTAARSAFNFGGWIEAWDYAGVKPRDSYERDAAKSAFIAGFYAQRKQMGGRRSGTKKSRRAGLMKHLGIFGW